MTMRVFVLSAMVLALTGCAPAVRDVALDGLDLADGATLASLQSKLPPDDRPYLGVYALLHWPKSKFYCGKPIGGRGPAAATIGEAVDQTRAWEMALARVTPKPSPPSAAEQARAREAAAVNRLEQLVFERDVLFAKKGGGAADTPEGRALTARVETARAELASLRGEG